MYTKHRHELRHARKAWPGTLVDHVLSLVLSVLAIGGLAGNQWYTDKKEKKIFLIYREIQNGAVAMSYMTKPPHTVHGEIFAPFLIYQEALPHI